MDQNVLDSMQKIVATAFAEKLFTDVEILLAAKNKILFHQAYSSHQHQQASFRELFSSLAIILKNSIFDLSLTNRLTKTFGYIFSGLCRAWHEANRIGKQTAFYLGYS